MRKLLLLSIFCLCQFAFAAENDPPVQETEQQNSDTAPLQGDVESESEQEIVDDGSDLIAAEVSETNEADAESSSRFIPTEEISQDLGVSFPVDI